jgi:G3E family GTPase
MSQTSSLIPVTLLTGFLGSGKTTLLNHLLTDPEAGRVAVVINEYGDVGLDHDLIVEASEEMVLLESGCICCSVRGDLVRALAGLAEGHRAGKLGFDRVVIETTGLADPGPILHTLLVDDTLNESFRLDGVVTTADCAVGARTLDRQFEAVNQIAMADRIVLTKTDLALPAERRLFEARLAQINPGAARVVAEMGRVPQGALFGIGTMDDAAAPDATLAWVNAAAYPAPKPVDLAKGWGNEPSHGLFGARQGISLAASPQRHDDRITSVSASFPDPIAADIFDLWLESLINMRGQDILRMKGIVFIDGADDPFALHGVQHVFHPPMTLKNWPKTDRTSRIVVIGRDLPPDLLSDSLDVLRTRRR